MFDLLAWPYLRPIPLTCNLETDTAGLLHANGKASTAVHCAAVARESARLAARFGLNPAPAKAAALLHDISAILAPGDMMAYAVRQGWTIDEAEKMHPFLLHQRLSAVMAEIVFGVEDRSVLSAIACHTTLKARPSEYDMLLFLADKLAWDQEGPPPFGRVVAAALEFSLPHACLAYMGYVRSHGMVLHPHRWLLEAGDWLEEALGQY